MMAKIASDDQLSLMNDSLVELNQKLITKKKPDKNVLFLIGVPRSGTTLLSQLLIDSLDIGYVSNTIARFWKCPGVGALLQNTLFENQRYVADGQSDFGATSGPLGPHEFGFFWRRWFHYGESHFVNCGSEGEKLLEEVAALEDILGRPMMFKNLAAGSLHARWLSEIFPTARFLWIRRDPIDVARSIYRARMNREGSADKWFSVKPSSYSRIKKLSVEEQIAYQILDIELHIHDQLKSVDRDRWAAVNYRDLVNNVRSVVGVAASLINMPFQPEQLSENILMDTPSKPIDSELDQVVRDVVLGNAEWQKLYSGGGSHV